jgi:hypothetical protein
MMSGRGSNFLVVRNLSEFRFPCLSATPELGRATSGVDAMVVEMSGQLKISLRDH